MSGSSTEEPTHVTNQADRGTKRQAPTSDSAILVLRCSVRKPGVSNQIHIYRKDCGGLYLNTKKDALAYAKRWTYFLKY
eukprot:scaffold475439_cov56-Prasinocladus_malaysianus.AAC.2